jgi:hypothetical protein
MYLEKRNPSKPLFHFSLLISQIDQALEVDGIAEPGNDIYYLLYIDPVTGTNAFLKEREKRVVRPLKKERPFGLKRCKASHLPVRPYKEESNE